MVAGLCAMSLFLCEAINATLSTLTHRMQHNIRAVLIGLGAAIALIVMFEAIGGEIWHFMNGVNMQDKEAVRAAMAAAPLASMIYLIASYGVAAFIGSFLARKMAGGIATRPSRIVAIGLTLACVANSMAVPEPTWVSIVSILTPLPMAWLGARLAGQSNA